MGLFRSHSKWESEVVHFRFASKRNAGNVRMYNLMNFSNRTQVFEFKGSSFGKLDYYLLKVFRLWRYYYIFRMRKRKIWIHLMSPVEILPKWHNQVLHLDDPEFTREERQAITNWYQNLSIRGLKALIVVTFEGAKKYIESINRDIPVEIIPQGFTPTLSLSEKFPGIACVYSSPYIFCRDGVGAPHPTWDVQHFIEILIPKILDLDSRISIHLVGRASYNTRRQLKDFQNVHFHGLVSPEENAQLLRSCHIGLYPRLHDHGRRVLKISEYLGAGLPVVAYELEDTRLVSELGVGLLVKNAEDFVASVKKLIDSSDEYSQIMEKIEVARIGLDWPSLARKLDSAI